MNNKYKVNREIALLLGFKFTKPKPKRGLDFEQVTYPNDWIKETWHSPVREFPDFLEMIKRYREIKEICDNGGIPLCYDFEVK